MDMFLLKGLKYKEVCPANLERAKYCILEGLDHSISNWCWNVIDKSFFLEWTNNVGKNIDQRIIYLADNLYKCKHTYWLSYPDVKNALNKT